MSRRRATVRATWNGMVIAESDDAIVVEGNHYFPRASIAEGALLDSSTRSLCPWKGVARYHSVQADGVVAADAAWFYPHPTPFARRVRDAWRSGTASWSRPCHPHPAAADNPQRTGEPSRFPVQPGGWMGMQPPSSGFRACFRQPTQENEP